MTEKELSRGQKVLQTIGYALSGFGGQIPKTLVDTFASVFLVTAVGISPTQIALMLLISKIIDAITDYLVGVWIDMTHCRFGRNRLWMLISIPTTVVGLIMLFTAPGFSAGMKLAWAYLSYNIVIFGLTMASVSANAIIPFLSSDPGERGMLVSAKLLLSMVGSMAVTGLISAMVNITGGAESVASYTKAAGMIGLVFAVVMCFAVATLHEKDYVIPVKEGTKSNPIKDLQTLFTTKNYLIVLVMGFGCMLVQIGMTNGAAYYAGYVLGDDALTGAILMPIMAGSMVPMLLMGILSRKMSKKRIVSVGSLIGAILCIVITLVGANRIALILFSLLEGVSFGMAYVTFFAMQPDVVDEVAYRCGHVMSGLQSSLAGFACNLGSAVAAATVAGLIGAAGYEAGVAQQSENVLRAIRIGTFLVPAAMMILLLIVIQFYDLDDHYAEIRAALGKPERGEHGKD